MLNHQQGLRGTHEMLKNIQSSLGSNYVDVSVRLEGNGCLSIVARWSHYHDVEEKNVSFEWISAPIMMSEITMMSFDFFDSIINNVKKRISITKGEVEALNKQQGQR